MKPLHSLVTLCLSLGLVACGGGYEGSPSPTDTSSQPLSVAGATNLTLVPTELGRVEVSGGSRPYSATSQNPEVALASVSDSTLSIAAVRGDTAPVSITVTDARNAKVSLSVSVTNSPALGTFTLAPRELALSPGASRTITISGGAAPFTAVTSKSGIASASVSGNTVTVAGLTEGVNAELRVIDSKGATQTALVTVAAPTPSASGLAPFTNMAASLTLRPNTSQTFTLGGGTGPYTAISSNPAAVATTVREGALTLKAGVGGSAILTITDNSGQELLKDVIDSTGTPQRERVTVRVLTTSAPLALNATSIAGLVGTTTTVGIAGGLPPYRTVSTSSTQVGTASIDRDTVKIAFSFVGGPMRVSVLDAENNSVDLNITATASSVLSPMSVSPSRIVVSELLSRDTTTGLPKQTSIPLLFVNGRAPLQVFSSHPRLLVPVANGNAVTVTSPGTADAPVAPCVDLNTEVFITGIDASGASASTSITITDNGPCPI